mmetsp:Transcript_13545/g.19664  ORF Transcript_13545/g.19664 Transcript_13545/m.19664 type:complete len:121 (-) Transcript_13545:762-1124(-)
MVGEYWRKERRCNYKVRQCTSASGTWGSGTGNDLGLSELNDVQRQAMEVLRIFFVERIWKCSITRCLCGWLRCKACHYAKIDKMFGNESSHVACHNCIGTRKRPEMGILIEYDKRREIYI